MDIQQSLLEKRMEQNEIGTEPNWIEGPLEAYKALETSIYATVFFYIDKEERLELRIRRVAFEAEPTGIGTDDIYEWLYETGENFVGQLSGRKVLLIESTDVEDGQFISTWNELTEVPLDEAEKKTS